MKGKRKIPKNWPIIFPKNVNDGEWQTIKIVKKNGKKIQIWLDNETKKPIRMPKTVVRGEIFLGGLPKGYTDNKELVSFFRTLKLLLLFC